ncbi:ABC transporter ATP-binding protein [Streptomyces sp. NPDC006477]|uniref:ABC transporter ATP-binding protein n=1 Tax=Streptomyces sp. NPDC006477 TaxID=3364747 RepID=UPI0036B8A452
MNPSTAVAVTGLTVRHRRTVALDRLDLSLGPGVHGLLGPNGAGKTSLIRVLATVAAPTAGRVELLGGDATDHRDRTGIRRRLGYLPQEFGYYPAFTVREFVAYVAWLKEMPADRVPAAVERAVRRVGLGDRIDARMKTLSGGMVRRAGIAQAIVNEPDLLLLDEPTAGLDPEQRVDFRALLRELGAETTVVVSTHLVEDVAAACGEVALIEAGRLAFQGTTAALTALGGGPGGRDDSTTHAVERGYTAALRAHRAPGAGAGAGEAGAGEAGTGTGAGEAGAGAGAGAGTSAKEALR